MPTLWRPTPLNSVYVLPDIHGNLELLNKCLKAILPLRHSDGGMDRLIVLGDMIDRHKDSCKVVDRLIELKKEYPDQIIFLIGNHELLLLKSLNLQKNRNHSLQTQQASFQIWLNNGGILTFSGYYEQKTGKEFDLNSDGVSRVGLANYIPKEHIEFFNSLLPYYEFEDYLFVHGGLDLLEPIYNQDVELLCWDRSTLKHVLELKAQNKEFEYDKVIVTGHSVLPNQNPIIEKNFLMLDCGSPKKLLMWELNSMTGYIAYPGQRLVKYEKIN